MFLTSTECLCSSIW